MADVATMSPSERGEVISLTLLIMAVNMRVHLMMARVYHYTSNNI